MNKQALAARTILSCSVLLAALMLTLPGLAQDDPKEPNIPGAANSSKKTLISFQPVMVIADRSIVPATGTILVRNRDSVFATMHTGGLAPGTVVTFWWGFFNKPENCATRPCTPADLSNPAVQGSVVNAGGKIIGEDGTATFGAFRRVGDTTGVFPGLGTVQGLLDPSRAEIHLVTRSHGPAIPDPEILRQQRSMFNGGCPPNICANLQASIHQPQR